MRIVDIEPSIVAISPAKSERILPQDGGVYQCVFRDGGLIGGVALTFQSEAMLRFSA